MDGYHGASQVCYVTKKKTLYEFVRHFENRENPGNEVAVKAIGSFDFDLEGGHKDINLLPSFFIK